MSRWLAEVACLFACALVAGAGVAVARAASRHPRVRTVLARDLERLDADLRLVGTPLHAKSWRALQGGAVALALTLALSLDRLAVGGLLGVCALGAPHLWLRRALARRVERLESQIDGWLVLLSNALKATPSLGEALASTVALVEPPLCVELDRVVKAHRFGVPLDHALTDMADRVGGRVVPSAVAALRIARRTGGNLHRTLDTCAASLRELSRVESFVRTRTAEGRAQATLVGALPLPLLLVLDRLDPAFLQPLFATARGHLVLGGAALLWLVAILWARRIVAVDV